MSALFGHPFTDMHLYATRPLLLPSPLTPLSQSTTRTFHPNRGIRDEHRIYVYPLLRALVQPRRRLRGLRLHHRSFLGSPRDVTLATDGGWCLGRAEIFWMLPASLSDLRSPEGGRIWYGRDRAHENKGFLIIIHYKDYIDYEQSTEC